MALGRTLAALVVSATTCEGGVVWKDGVHPLFENGRSVWVVAVPENAAPPVRYAAAELTNTLGKISGAKFDVVSATMAPQRNVIRLDCSGNEMEETFSVRTKPDAAVFSGNSPRAILYAVYAFLQEVMDVRWYWPGESGEFLPKIDRFDMVEWEKTWHPIFPFREMSICTIWRHRHPDTERWFAKMFFNCGIGTSEIQEELGFLKRYGGHLISLPVVMKDREALFAEHQDWFSLLNGKRDIKGIAGCWSNEGFFRYLVENFAGNVGVNGKKITLTHYLAMFV